jgi:simple sugar transport system ATP-binding protein
MNSMQPIIEADAVSKRFAGSDALKNVSLTAYAGEVLCLLGDNGAGKSTLINMLSGVHAPSSGVIRVDGKPVQLSGPRDAMAHGIATVQQSGGTVPLMSVARNFFLGAEPTKGRGPFRIFDTARAKRTALEQIRALGLQRVTDADQLVGSLSGGERQGLAIARALHFGARVLILDEPTSALGVKEAGVVLRLVARARDRGVCVILVTHNAHHALSVGDRFVVLIHGSVAAAWKRDEKSREEVLSLMAGGEELEQLELELRNESAADDAEADPETPWTPSERSSQRRDR